MTERISSEVIATMTDIRGFFGRKKEAASATAETSTIVVASVSSIVKDAPTATPSKEESIDEALSKLSQNATTDIVTSTSPSSSSSGKHIMPLASFPSSVQSLVTWTPGERVPFSALVQTFEAVSNVSGRLEKESLFAKLFMAVVATTPEDLESIIYLSSNTIAPAYDGLELGIGDALLVKAICDATGRNKSSVEEDYKREGDLGVVALISRASQKTLSFVAKPKPLSAAHILEQYRLITRTKGDKSQGRKVDIIKAIMTRCVDCEAKYIIRGLQGKLRIGTAAQTILVSLAHAFAAQMIPTTIFSSSSTSSSSISGDICEDENVDSVYSTNGDKMVVSDDGNNNSTSMGGGESKMLESIVKIPIKEPPEAKKLRLGNLTKEVRNECAVIAVKRAFSECPNLSMLCAALLARPLEQLYHSCRLIQGVPVSPMLAKPTKAILEVLRRLEGLAFTMEYKYDGERAQVHLLPNGDVKIFSRNSEDNSSKYPELTEVIKSARNEHLISCVIDAEVVAYDREKKCLQPFQLLSKRKRKVDDGEDQDVKVVLQAFDMLFINGKSLLQESLRTRRTLLHSAFSVQEGLFYFASGLDHVENGDTAPLELYLQESCAAMCEGLMVKTLDHNASYEPSKRSLNWLKVKKDYINGMGICDSVDLVVIGAYHGRGKRVNTYGAYLVACYDPDRDEYQSVCKVGTGFTDENLIRLSEKMNQHVVDKRPFNYNTGDPLTPDIWFDAAVLWEIQAADLSTSTVHKGGIGKIENSRDKGIGLRFPRYLRDRDDKKPENATSAEQIVELYLSQDVVNTSGGNDNDEDDEDAI